MKKFILPLLLFVAYIILKSSTSLITDIWWFDNITFLDVYTKTLYSKFLIGLTIFATFFVFIQLNIWVANKATFSNQFQTTILAKLPTKFIPYILMLGVAVISFVSALTASNWWESILQAIHQQPANIKDPIFAKDISFYFFELSLIQTIIGWLFTLLFFCTIASIFVYAGKGILEIGALLSNLGNKFKLQLPKSIKYHLSILLALFFLLLAVKFHFNKYDILYENSNILYGASYTSIHGHLLAYNVMAIVSLVTACFLILIYFIRVKFIVLASIIGLWAGSYFLFKIIVPSIQQRFIVEPNELEKEKPYIEHNIKYTRIAYNLHKVKKVPYSTEGSIQAKDLKKNKATLENIRLWDYRPLLDTYKQLQEIRLYYKFNDVDIDRYKINNQYRQVMLSARELDYNEFSEKAKNWVNQRLQYTHGYGVVMSPVNEVMENGSPSFFLKDIPPTSNIGITLKRPEIYYGESTNHYIFTGATIDEFDYPSGNANQYTRYKGKGGVALNSLFRKLMYSLHFQSAKMLISKYLGDQTKVHYIRNIKDRVAKIAPFLSYDEDPYITIVKGKIYWILDAYTISDKFPYAKPIGRFNYIRNSVKVIVDAYSGEVSFYIIDKNDLIIQTYQKIFPNLFKDISACPPEFQEHFRYPHDLFMIQSNIYSTYHMSDVNVFYNKEDSWRISQEVYEGNKQFMEPYYTILNLPNEKEQEFISILPFTPVKKDNMIAWFAARSDLKNYGELILYTFSKKNLIYGPLQIEARIDQDPSISEVLTLWNQQGSQVIRGNLLVLPIANSLLYVEPLFLQAEQSKMPELKRVIMSYKDKVIMANNLEEALNQVFDGNYSLESSEFPKKSSSTSTKQLVKEALSFYEKSQTALKSSQWAKYGKYQKQLKSLLEQLNKK